MQRDYNTWVGGDRKSPWMDFANIQHATKTTQTTTHHGVLARQASYHACHVWYCTTRDLLRAIQSKLYLQLALSWCGQSATILPLGACVLPSLTESRHDQALRWSRRAVGLIQTTLSYALARVERSS